MSFSRGQRGLHDGNRKQGYATSTAVYPATLCRISHNTRPRTYNAYAKLTHYLVSLSLSCHVPSNGSRPPLSTHCTSQCHLPNLEMLQQSLCSKLTLSYLRYQGSMGFGICNFKAWRRKFCKSWKIVLISSTWFPGWLQTNLHLSDTVWDIRFLRECYLCSTLLLPSLVHTCSATRPFELLMLHRRRSRHVSRPCISSLHYWLNKATTNG